MKNGSDYYTRIKNCLFTAAVELSSMLVDLPALKSWANHIITQKSKLLLLFDVLT